MERTQTPNNGARIDSVVLPLAEMTVYRAQELKDQLLAALDASPALELNLACVDEMDLAGLQLLILAKREATRQGKSLTLTHHSPVVMQIIDFCNLAGLFGDPLLITECTPQ